MVTSLLHSCHESTRYRRHDDSGWVEPVVRKHPSAPGGPTPGGGPAPAFTTVSITSLSPALGSTAGGTVVIISGAGFRPGATVRLDNEQRVASFDSSTTMRFTTPARAAGSIDVVVTNIGGDSTRLAGAYTFTSPASFDFNGAWTGYAVAHPEIDLPMGPHHSDMELQFTVRGNAIAGFSCGTLETLFSPPRPVTNGEFSFTGNGGVKIHRQDRFRRGSRGNRRHRLLSRHQVVCQKTVELALLRVVAVTGWTIALMASPVSAQGDAALRGQAVAAADGSAVAGALVSLESASAGESIETTTDIEGWFLFPNVRPGEYVLSTAPQGFRPRKLQFALQPREIKILTLSLELPRVEVSLQVTADTSSIPSTHSPSSTLLSAERLEAIPESQRQSLTDAIVTLAPGMIRGHDDFVHIRGHEIALNPSINGVSFWENPHAVFSAGLSAEIVDTANVMTGGFSAEYGNRFGGVVDVITKSGLVLGNTGTLTVNLGESGRRNLSGEIAGRRESFGYYAFGSVFESARFLSPPDVTAIHDHARGGRMFAQLDKNFGRAGSVRGVLILDGTDFEIPKTPLDVTVRPLANATQRNRQQSAIIGWTGSVSDLAVSTSFYQRWSRAQLLPAAGPLTATAELTRALRTVGGKVDITRFAGRHGLKMGVDAVSLRPTESLSYNANGYVVFTHLLNLPHIHFPTTDLEFDGRESGTQFSAYIARCDSVRQPRDRRRRHTPRSIRSGCVGTAREPARQRGHSGRPGRGVAPFLQPFFCTSCSRRGVVEQRRVDDADRRDWRAASAARADDRGSVRAWRICVCGPHATVADCLLPRDRQPRAHHRLA